MATTFKSDKYPGVYWYEVDTPDKLGKERLYYIRYRRGGRGSKQINEPIGRSSQGMTEAKANRERAERIGGKLCNTEKRKEQEKQKITEASEPIFEALFHKFIEAHQKNASIKMDEYNYKHVEKFIGKKSISEIATPDIETIRKSAEKKGLSPQTVKHVLTLVRRILRYGVKLGLCAMPANLLFEMPRLDNQKTENLSQEQLAAYLKAIDDEPDQNAASLLRIALVTGMRRGALLGLKWDDLDFERGMICLRGETAKNGKTEFIPMNEACRKIFEKIERTGEYVWPGKDGRQRSDFRRIARRVRDKAGLPKDFRPLHGLRHSFASALASSGKVDLYTLQRLLTHGSAEMTQRYAHLADDALKRASNVGNFLAGDQDDDDK